MIYNYVLCWLYSMTKSVVIALILFLVFCGSFSAFSNLFWLERMHNGIFLIFRENNLVPLGLFNLFRSTLVYFSPLLPIWSTLVYFGLFGPIWSILAYLVHCVCKVVIYNYVLYWLYFMTKSVVIALILFLVFCEILLYWV